MQRKLQKLADRLTNRCPARLTRDQKIDPEFFLTHGESPDLGRFPAALRAFERDKNAARHDVDLETRRRSCRIVVEAGCAVASAVLSGFSARKLHLGPLR